MISACKSEFELALEKPQKESDINCASWDGIVVGEYLKRVHGKAILV